MDLQLSAHQSILFNQCHDEFCCNLNSTVSLKPSYRYAAAVYHGNQTFDGFADGGVIACAVLV